MAYVGVGLVLSGDRSELGDEMMMEASVVTRGLQLTDT
jgi:hypothetical protein